MTDFIDVYYNRNSVIRKRSFDPKDKKDLEIFIKALQADEAVETIEIESKIRIKNRNKKIEKEIKYNVYCF